MGINIGRTFRSSVTPSGRILLWPVIALLLVSISLGQLSVELVETHPGIAAEQSGELLFDNKNTDVTHEIEGFLLCRSPDDAVVSSSYGTVMSGAQYVSSKFQIDEGPSYESMMLRVASNTPGDKRTGCVVKYIPYKVSVTRIMTTNPDGSPQQALQEVRQYLRLNGEYVGEENLQDGDYREIRLDRTVPFVPSGFPGVPQCPPGKSSCTAAELAPSQLDSQDNLSEQCILMVGLYCTDHMVTTSGTDALYIRLENGMGNDISIVNLTVKEKSSVPLLTCSVQSPNGVINLSNGQSEVANFSTGGLGSCVERSGGLVAGSKYAFDISLLYRFADGTFVHVGTGEMIATAVQSMNLPVGQERAPSEVISTPAPETRKKIASPLQRWIAALQYSFRVYSPLWMAGLLAVLLLIYRRRNPSPRERTPLREYHPEFCPHCGARLANEDSFCPDCGCKVT